MGTKNNPGKYDCYEKAEPDEPIFTLRANDNDAPFLVMNWAYLKKAEGQTDEEKINEAFQCAQAMRDWKDEHHGE